MIKKNSLLTLAALCLMAGSACADSTSTNLSAAANVSAHLDMSIYVRENQNQNVVNYNASSLNFGELINDSVGAPLRGTSYFDVVMFANTSSRPYRITQSASQLSNGSDVLPAGACIVTPWSTDVDGNALPSGSSPNVANHSFVQNDLVLFSSDAEGRSAAPVATYALTSDPSAGATEVIPVDMKSGAYSSNITITLELL